MTKDSYIVACDGVMESLADTSYGQASWEQDNPAEAAREFAEAHSEFELGRPTARFGDEYVVDGLTYWPDAWLKRVR